MIDTSQTTLTCGGINFGYTPGTMSSYVSNSTGWEEICRREKEAAEKARKERDKLYNELEALKKKKVFPAAKRILKNGDYMTVLWDDGTKTIVKRAEDEAESDYAAFTAALGIKCYGTNSALKKVVASAEWQHKKKQKKTQKEA